MFRPIRNIPTNMEGGAYISSLKIPSTPSDISISSLQFIMAKANLTSLDAIATLTTAQLQNLTSAIDEQIRADESLIASNTSRITSLSNDINRAGGLTDQYNDALDEFNIATQEYHRISSLIIGDNKLRDDNNSTLRNLYSISTAYTSSISSYTSQYNILMQQLQINASTVDIYQKIYEGRIQALSVNKILLDTSQTNYLSISSTVHACNISLENLSVAPSIRSTISTSCGTDQTKMYNISTDVQTYKGLDRSIQNELYSTFNILASYINISSLRYIEASSYSNLIGYYRGLENTTTSTINTILSDIAAYEAEIARINQINISSQTQFDREVRALKNASIQFYGYLKGALQSECDEFTYGVQEYSAQIGFITASLGIAINANAIKIDENIYKLLDTSITSANRTTFMNEKSELETDNTGMNGIISDINTLDLQFSNIVQKVNEEKSYKNEFIIKREGIFNTYEVPALSMTPAERLTIKTNYRQAFTELNAIVTSINSRIGDRTRILGDINTIVDAKKTSINNYFRKFFNITEDQLPNNLTRILDANGENFGGTSIPNQSWDLNDIGSPESQYEMVRPIDFS
jgi:hypothetical protein